MPKGTYITDEQRVIAEHYIKKMVPEYNSDVVISEFLKDEGIGLTDKGVGAIRKRLGLQSGAKLKQKHDLDLTTKTWNETKSVIIVSEALNITAKAARAKIIYLMDRKVLERTKDMVSIPRDYRKGMKLKQKKKKDSSVQKDKTIISTENILAMRQRKLDRVAELQNLNF